MAFTTKLRGVTLEFLFSKTSGISIEICSVGYLRTSDRNRMFPPE
ncbi:BnaA02g36370D [Brassica napus]|uniref:BnaA02g36370D protein n=1 Tax=Brassica napus TaxID=3708 RepID=A0A078IV48_BRANA|nr:BnaA02g36370D [Brassica napus]